jgi:hypothetical protein
MRSTSLAQETLQKQFAFFGDSAWAGRQGAGPDHRLDKKSAELLNDIGADPKHRGGIPRGMGERITEDSGP